MEYTRGRNAKFYTKSEIMALLGLLILLGNKTANHINLLELWETDGTEIEITNK